MCKQESTNNIGISEHNEYWCVVHRFIKGPAFAPHGPTIHIGKNVDCNMNYANNINEILDEGFLTCSPGGFLTSAWY